MSQFTGCFKNGNYRSQNSQNQKLPLKIQIWQKRAKICKEMPTKNSKNYQMLENCSKMAKNPKINHSKAKM